jgi:hypothetical protein
MEQTKSKLKTYPEKNIRQSVYVVLIAAYAQDTTPEGHRDVPDVAVLISLINTRPVPS